MCVISDGVDGGLSLPRFSLGRPAGMECGAVGWNNRTELMAENNLRGRETRCVRCIAEFQKAAEESLAVPEEHVSKLFRVKLRAAVRAEA